MVDKITILEIKVERLRDPHATANCRRELERLSEALASLTSPPVELVELKIALGEVNRRLWDIEDGIRHKEADQTFDATFIELARRVYVNNDERARIKRAIDVALCSDVFDEKQYAAY